MLINMETVLRNTKIIKIMLKFIIKEQSENFPEMEVSKALAKIISKR